MSFFIGQTDTNRFINGSLLNPSHGWYVATATLTANVMYGTCFYNDGRIIIDGCSVVRSVAGAGNLTTAIYKYDTIADQLVKVDNTNINTWNTAATGTQTISITPTTLDMGIYVMVIIADTTNANHSGYTTQFPYTPLGLDSGLVTYQSITKTLTYVADLPGTLPIDSVYWTYNNSYYGQYASFLLNQA